MLRSDTDLVVLSLVPVHGPWLCGFRNPCHSRPLKAMRDICCLVHICIHKTLPLWNNEIPSNAEKIPWETYNAQNRACSSSKGLPTVGDASHRRPALKSLSLTDHLLSISTAKVAHQPSVAYIRL